MKLSKAQQAVVDKMREGWKLFHSSDAFIILRHPEQKGYDRVWYSTYYSLKRHGVIGVVAGTTPAVYHLSEQYKTENNENSNTGDTTE